MKSAASRECPATGGGSSGTPPPSRIERLLPHVSLRGWGRNVGEGRKFCSRPCGCQYQANILRVSLGLELVARGGCTEPLFVDFVVGAVFAHLGQCLIGWLDPFAALVKDDAVLLAFIERANHLGASFTASLGEVSDVGCVVESRIDVTTQQGHVHVAVARVRHYIGIITQGLLE